jgi:uncharacterized coiled-coil DUF342 family protein
MHDELHNQYIRVVEENNILRCNIIEMQKEIHNFQVRIKELLDETNYYLLKYGKN